MQDTETFFQAVLNGNVMVVNHMLKQDSSLVTSLDENESSPLHLAATEGYVALAEELIVHGADLNSRDAWGRTPLMVSIYAEPLAEHYPIVQLLISRGADINLIDKDGSTALHVAGFGEPNIVAFLLANGADVDAQDNQGMTPLHNAVLYPEHEVVKLLLRETSAGVGVKNKAGLTPLDIAKENGWGSIIALIEANSLF